MVVENISEDSAVGHTMGGLTMTPTFELDLPASPRLSTGALADRSEGGARDGSSCGTRTSTGSATSTRTSTGRITQEIKA